MERKGANGRYEAVPFFVLNRSEAAVMSEAAAKAFVARLRSLGVNSAWLEDARDGRRIKLAGESTTQSGEDSREAVAASLDDANFYVVKQSCRPDGRKWFLKIIVPGLLPRALSMRCWISRISRASRPGSLCALSKIRPRRHSDLNRSLDEIGGPYTSKQSGFERRSVRAESRIDAASTFSKCWGD
jgi:hypothetical protein